MYNINLELGFKTEDNILEKRAPAENKIRLLGKKHEKFVITLRSAAELYKKYYNAKHKVFRFKVGDKIILATKNLR